MANFACFGEVLVRLSSQKHQLLRSAQALDVHVGGAEANVAVGLASLGHSARMISCVPDNGLGDMAQAALRSANVDCAHLRKAPGRMGLYFLAPGAGHRASEIIYDRSDSAFSGLDAASYDWVAALEGVTHLHLSGITPALGPAAAHLALGIVRAAKDIGVTVSFDVNYRSRLWGAWSRDPRTILFELISHVDILFANHRDFALLLDRDFDGAQSMCARAPAEAGFAEFSNLKIIASTSRQMHSADRQVLSARVDTRSEAFEGEKIRLTTVVDRIGAGDAFAVGVLHHAADAVFDGEAAARTGLALAALKHSMPGDSGAFSRADIEAFYRREYDVRR